MTNIIPAYLIDIFSLSLSPNASYMSVIQGSDPDGIKTGPGSDPREKNGIRIRTLKNNPDLIK